jgi:hypothetical protein
MRAYYVIDNCGKIEKSQTIEGHGLPKKDFCLYVMGIMFGRGLTNQIPFAVYINDGSGYCCYESNSTSLEQKIYESFFGSQVSKPTVTVDPTIITIDERKYKLTLMEQ